MKLVSPSVNGGEDILNFSRFYTGRGAADGLGTELLAGGMRVRFPMGSLGFLVDLILAATPWPWD